MNEDKIEKEMNNKNGRYQLIKKMIPRVKNGFALDYGCGFGHYSIILLEKGYKYIGFDIDKDKIKEAKNRFNGENIDFIEDSITTFKDGSFDLILSNMVMEHVHNPGIFLNEINRILKNNGVFIVGIPNIITFNFILSNFTKNIKKKLICESNRISKNYDKGNDHINSWDSFHFIRLVSSMGFLLVDMNFVEGQSFPFNHYFFVPGRMKNFSYSMCFCFNKIKDCYVGVND